MQLADIIQLSIKLPFSHWHLVPKRSKSFLNDVNCQWAASNHVCARSWGQGKGFSSVIYGSLLFRSSAEAKRWRWEDLRYIWSNTFLPFSVHPLKTANSSGKRQGCQQPPLQLLAGVEVTPQVSANSTNKIISYVQLTCSLNPEILVKSWSDCASVLDTNVWSDCVWFFHNNRFIPFLMLEHRVRLYYKKKKNNVCLHSSFKLLIIHSVEFFLSL